MLAQLAQRPKDHDTRLRAARAARVQCFRAGDPHNADVAESLVVDRPRLFPRSKRAELDKLAAQASAIRRAVAMAHRLSHSDPHSLGRALSEDPDSLAEEVQRRLDDDQPALARALLEVALSRHADHPSLRGIRERFQQRWPYGAPITDED